MDVPEVSNPFSVEARYDPRFSKVLTKLWVWNMTEYDSIGTGGSSVCAFALLPFCSVLTLYLCSGSGCGHTCVAERR